jgi:membrane protein DedA with SNARE-associated domain
VSGWLGHYCNNEPRSIRLLLKPPALLKRGEAFFKRHGGKSVLHARFIGPVRHRSAGCGYAQRVSFYLYNVLSALAWVPV